MAELIELVYDTTKTDKLAKNGVKYTEALFDKIEKKLLEIYKSCGSYEEFLEKTQVFTAENPLIMQGYDTYMKDLVLKAISDVSFSRAAQRELTEIAISNSVGDLVKDNGEDLKRHIREVSKRAYQNGTPPQQYWKELQAPPLKKGEGGAKRNLSSRERCKMIARTETKRALNISNYVVAKERGATHWYALGFTDEHTCRNCIDTYGTPSDPKYYEIDDTSNLPPLHPNCRHTAVYVNKKKDTDDSTEETEDDTTDDLPIPTPAQLKKNLKPAEREKYNSYQRNIILQRAWLEENPNAPAEEIAKHKKRLAFLEKKFRELKLKALGMSEETGSEPKPEPKKPKKPETKKPETEPTQFKTPTREQIEQNLTKKEREEYKLARDQIKWARDVLKNPNMTQKQKDYAQKSLDETIPKFKKLNDKALGLTQKTTPKKRKTKSKKEEEAFKLNKPTEALLTKEELDKLDFTQLAEHHDARYIGFTTDPVDNKEYHTFVQSMGNGQRFRLRMEKGAVNSYKKGGVATPNEIIHEVFKVPKVLRENTDDIVFRNTQASAKLTRKGDKYANFRQGVGGHNVQRAYEYKHHFKHWTDPNHRIAINAKLFKKLSTTLDKIYYREDEPTDISLWKHTVHHEFHHSIDLSRKIWDADEDLLSERPEYYKLDQEEGRFTEYANGWGVGESFAEHGGYISYMEANPSEQDKKILIHLGYKDGKKYTPKINYKEYKERYPKHYEYFMKLYKTGA